jgi:hypothetical protein
MRFYWRRAISMTDLEEKKKGKGEERRGKKKTKYKG